MVATIKCPECGGNDLTWIVGSRYESHYRGQVYASLGCNECSHTVYTIGRSEIEAILNKEEK